MRRVIIDKIMAMADFTIEPFTSAEDTAHFLCITRRHLLVMARRGMRGAYGLGTGAQRKTWVFRLSEVSRAVTADGNIGCSTRCGNMASAVPAE